MAAALLTVLACNLPVSTTGLVAGLRSQSIPVHVEAVANVVGRAEPMAPVGYAAALLCAAAGRGATAAISRTSRWPLPSRSRRRARRHLAGRRPALAPPDGSAGGRGTSGGLAATLPITAYFGARVLRPALASGVSRWPGAPHLTQRAWGMIRSRSVVAAALVPGHLSADYSPGELVLSTGLTLAPESDPWCGSPRWARGGGVAGCRGSRWAWSGSSCVSPVANSCPDGGPAPPSARCTCRRFGSPSRRGAGMSLPWPRRVPWRSWP